MSKALQLDDPPVTISAFDEFLERKADSRPWELVAGRIVGMTNPNQVHEQIVSSIGVPLERAADSRGCFTFFGGMRIQRSDNRDAVDKPRPDLLVRCGKLQRQNDVTDPLDCGGSAIALDYGLRSRREAALLQAIANAHSNCARISGPGARRAVSAGRHRLEQRVLTHPSDILVFPVFSCGLSLSETYERVDWEP